MLREIHISNLAVIADARIELDAGLNCFTGATGAGKSLVIGAIEVLLGLRSHGDLLRRGADEGRVSGVFEITSPEVRRRLAEVTDVAISGSELLLTRRLHASGRSSVSLNGQPITLSMLKLAAECLIDIHGQHDHQHLLKPAHQLEVLDDYAGAAAVRAEYEQVWAQWSQARARLAELSEGKALREQQLELLRFQASEIDAAALVPGEHAALTQRARLLGNAQRLRNDAGACHAALDDGDEPLVRQAKSVAATLSQLAEIDPGLRNVALAVKEAAVGLQEAAFDLARYLDHIEVDPESLAAANDRLTLIGKLASKYAKPKPQAGRTLAAGPSTELAAPPSEPARAAGPPASGLSALDEESQVLAFREHVQQRIEELQSLSENLEGTEAAIAPLEARARMLASELSAARSRAAGELAAAVERGLADLGMPKARLAIDVRPVPSLCPSGADAVEFLASTNPGLSPAPLRKIASGGELSRIMLALKGILSSDSRVSVLVFDEIDANVGGRLGAVIGAKLRSLASKQQVLCITHLPQIAAHADRHLTVRKCQTESETSSTVRVMTGDDRLREIAEMISGDTVTPTTLAQAQELIDVAAASPRSSAQARPTGRRVGSASQPHGGGSAREVGVDLPSAPPPVSRSSHRSPTVPPARLSARSSARSRSRSAMFRPASQG